MFSLDQIQLQTCTKHYSTNAVLSVFGSFAIKVMYDLALPPSSNLLKARLLRVADSSIPEYFLWLPGVIEPVPILSFDTDWIGHELASCSTGCAVNVSAYKNPEWEPTTRLELELVVCGFHRALLHEDSTACAPRRLEVVQTRWLLQWRVCKVRHRKKILYWRLQISRVLKERTVSRAPKYAFSNFKGFQGPVRTLKSTTDSASNVLLQNTIRNTTFVSAALSNLLLKSEV